MMNDKRILSVAMEQSALDLGCAAGDFLGPENRVVLSRPHPLARKYLSQPLFCTLVSYGANVVASVDGRMADFVKGFLTNRRMEDCFETPGVYPLARELRRFGQLPCFMSEYFLPDPAALRPLSCGYPVRLLGPGDFAGLYRPEWSNALCEKRRELDMLAACAFDGEKLVGMAGCSADCETMWQIGVDVLPDYRRKGIAAALTSRLAAETLALDKVPFYCAAWSNLPSVNNALKSGFRPAWVELNAAPASETMEIAGAEEG